MNSVNRLPVPSIPGSKTSLARVLDTELMLAGVLDLVCPGSGILSNFVCLPDGYQATYRNATFWQLGDNSLTNPGNNLGKRTNRSAAIKRARWASEILDANGLRIVPSGSPRTQHRQAREQTLALLVSGGQI
jgi:hypothetical protein